MRYHRHSVCLEATWNPLTDHVNGLDGIAFGAAFQDFFPFAGGTSATAASAVSSRKVKLS